MTMKQAQRNAIKKFAYTMSVAAFAHDVADVFIEAGYHVMKPVHVPWEPPGSLTFGIDSGGASARKYMVTARLDWNVTVDAGDRDPRTLRYAERVYRLATQAAAQAIRSRCQQIE